MDDDDFYGDYDDEDMGYGDDDVGDDGFGNFDDEMEEHKAEYTALDTQELLQRVDKQVEDVTDTLGVPAGVASMLLRLNKWNKEDLVSRFFDNKKKVLEECGLPNFDGTPDPPANPKAVRCPICDEDFNVVDCYALPCGHWFCTVCWCDYLEDKIKQGKLSATTHCAMYKCKQMITDDVVVKMFALGRKVPPSDPLLLKYKQQVLRSFVEDNPKLKWCPAPRCGRAIQSHAAATSVKCKCNFKFCFSCNEEAHDPCTCDQLQTWLDKCRNESETAHWIIANTKKCPKCKVRIEKNQGCNHMNCRSCKYEFCWVCMGPWAEHGNHTGGYYKCNKYNPKKKKEKTKKTGKRTKEDDAEDAKQEAQAELDRYLHYYSRYHNHDQSKKFAGKQAELVEARMKQLQASDAANSTWIDVQYLKSASDMVMECRLVLKYTYVFGYYLENGPEKELFEFLQQELEKNTEHLSELCETEVELINQSEVVNYTRITAKFMQNLLDGVQRGLTQAGASSSSSAGF